MIEAERKEDYETENTCRDRIKGKLNCKGFEESMVALSKSVN
jgi:hypothetical protein